MSGIYGIYRYDGAPVEPHWLDCMKTAMRYYGPHGGNCLTAGNIGLGHLLLQVNPEDAFEKQPVASARGWAVNAARLDNREALLGTFDISAPDAAQVSDGHLVSLAFECWGEELCSHLQGDWALAAWDARQHRLLLARDACGNATLYYYEGQGFIAFASSLKALLALPGAVLEPDYLRLAHVLVSWQPDAELTAYKNFRRLVWAHAMSIGAGGQIRMWRHWSPAGREMLAYRRNEEYEEAFLEHYTQAVQSCLRFQGPVAATLSGGRDSSSVVVLAAQLLANQGRGLTAYTSVPCLPPDGAGKRRLGNEWEIAHAAAAMAGENVSHLPIDAANYGVIQGIEHLLDAHDGPSHAAMNHYWLQAIIESISQSGAKGVLMGTMGNATVSWSGNGSALRAFLQGDPAMAWRLFFHAEPNPWLMLKRQILKPLLIPGLQTWQRLQSLRRKPWQAYSALNLHLASELNLDERMRAAGHDPNFTLSPLADLHSMFFAPDFGIGSGIETELGAMHSLVSLDPTSNLPLVEFILRVPDDQFCQRGRSSLMNRAFWDKLPAAVLSGKRKGLQAADAGHRILRELPAFQECLHSLDSLPAAQHVLDMPLLHRCLEDLVAKVDPGTTARASMILLRGLGVGLFLHHLASPRTQGMRTYAA